jgi:dihydroneopterin aldolase
MVKNRLCLKEMEFYSFFGWHSIEHSTGGKYSVNVCFEYESDIDEKIDRIDQTYDYELVFLEVKKIMTQKILLIEEAARRIYLAIKKLFNDPSLILEVTLVKHNPPIGNTKSSSITIKA